MSEGMEGTPPDKVFSTQLPTETAPYNEEIIEPSSLQQVSTNITQEPNDNKQSYTRRGFLGLFRPKGIDKPIIESTPKDDQPPQPEPDGIKETPKITRRTFNKALVSAFIASTAAPMLLRSSEFRRKDYDRFKSVTSLDFQEFSSRFGMEMESFIENPNGTDKYLIMLGQTHHSPVNNTQEGSSKKFLQSQDSIEFVIKHLVENKGLKAVYFEGVSDSSAETYEVLNLIKNDVDKTEMSVEGIDATLSNLRDYQLQVSDVLDIKSIGDVINRPFNELKAAIYYAHEQYILKAFEFLSSSKNVEISPDFELHAKLVQEKLNEISGEKREILPAHEYLQQKVAGVISEMESFKKKNGFDSIRSMLTASLRLGTDGIIKVMPTERDDLNQQSIQLVRNLNAAVTELQSDPKNPEKIEALEAAQLEYDTHFATLQAEREQYALGKITNPDDRRSLRVAVFGDRHDYADNISSYNTNNSTNSFGYFQVGKINSSVT